MKFKRKIKTNVILSFVITLLVLSVIDFSFVPQTNSKFKTSGGIDKYGIKLEYAVGLYPLYREGLTYTDSEIPNFVANQQNQNFSFEFTIPRQPSEITSDVTEDNVDSYIFTPSSGCSISKINGNDVSNDFKVSYDHPTAADENITVGVQCDETVKPPEGGRVNFSVKVSEKIGSEDSFDYTEYKFVINEEFYNDKMGIVKWENPLTRKYGYGQNLNQPQQLYDEFTNWIDGYFRYSLHLEENSAEEIAVKQYLHMYGTDVAYQNYVITTGSSWGTPIKGLDISAIPGGTASRRYYTYTYEIKDNLVGYALTAKDPNKKFNMYFTTKNSEEIELAFKYYLENSGYTESERNAIEEYIQARGGISKVILNNKVILGVRFDGVNRVSLEARLLEYAESLKNYKGDPLEHLGNSTMLINFHSLVNGIDILSDTLKDRTNPNALYRLIGANNIVKNNTTDGNAKSFIDYYFSYDVDNNYYIVTQIYSDISKNVDNKMNFYNFSVLSLPLSVDIFDTHNDENDPDKLTIQLIAPFTYEDESGNLISVDENTAKKNIESVAITLRNNFPDIGQLDSATGEVINIWTTSTKYSVPTFERTDDGWLATFVVSKGYNDGWISSKPSEDSGTQSESNSEGEMNTIMDSQAVQETIDKVTSAAASAAEGMKESNEVEDVPVSNEENKGLAMISSIMKFMLRD